MIKRDRLRGFGVSGGSCVEFAIVAVVASEGEIVEGVVAVVRNGLNVVNGEGIE